MKYKIFFLFFLSGFFLQENKAQSTINATGNSISSGTNRLDYSIGEIAIATITDAKNNLTQGVLQPLIIQILATEDGTFEKKFQISAYPNPAMEYINISTDYTDFQTLILFDNNGKTRKQETFQGQMISVVDLPSGIYFITLNDKKYSKTIKFIKQ